MKESDLVIPLGPTIDNYEELRYVLRSAEKHLKVQAEYNQSGALRSAQKVSKP